MNGQKKRSWVRPAIRRRGARAFVARVEINHPSGEGDKIMKKTRHVVAPAVALCLTLLALTSVPTQAQSFTGSISGAVSDPSGAVVSNATVTLTALATGQTRAVTTNHAGEYNFPTLPTGKHKVPSES